MLRSTATAPQNDLSHKMDTETRTHLRGPQNRRRGTREREGGGAELTYGTEIEPKTDDRLRETSNTVEGDKSSMSISGKVWSDLSGWERVWRSQDGEVLMNPGGGITKATFQRYFFARRFYERWAAVLLRGYFSTPAPLCFMPCCSSLGAIDGELEKMTSRLDVAGWPCRQTQGLNTRLTFRDIHIISVCIKCICTLDGEAAMNLGDGFSAGLGGRAMPKNTISKNTAYFQRYSFDLRSS